MFGDSVNTDLRVIFSQLLPEVVPESFVVFVEVDHFDSGHLGVAVRALLVDNVLVLEYLSRLLIFREVLGIPQELTKDSRVLVIYNLFEESVLTQQLNGSRTIAIDRAKDVRQSDAVTLFRVVDRLEQQTVAIDRQLVGLHVSDLFGDCQVRNFVFSFFLRFHFLLFLLLLY